VLAEGEVLPLGGGAPEKVDLHVICATHRDLEQRVAEGRFREDLFYRLNAATFRLPPLRERTDRREVILHVFGEECAAAGRDIVPEESLVDDLAAYHWPGNIRQLRNALRYAVAVCDADRMTREHLPEAIVSALVAPSPRERSETDLPEDEADERRRMLEALEATGWRATEAAQRAGIPRATFYRRMARYGLGRGRGAAG
jgi:transcriptional regulator of acetoin/glycerol metabolism